MHEQVDDQRTLLKTLLKDGFDSSAPVFPTQAVGERLVVDVGRRAVHILHVGAAHTAGDLMVWLPSEKILFAGDIAYTERLPAVLPSSRTQSWTDAFKYIEGLEAKVIVPGHGQPTTLARAQQDTLEYLRHLRAESKRLFDAGGGPGDAADQIDQSRWRHLANFKELYRRNANMVFLEIEREAF